MKKLLSCVKVSDCDRYFQTVLFLYLLLLIFSRDILELRNMMSEMQRRVDIKPWTIQPPSDYKLDTKSQASLNSETASSAGLVSHPTAGLGSIIFQLHSSYTPEWQPSYDQGINLKGS